MTNLSSSYRLVPSTHPALRTVASPVSVGDDISGILQGMFMTLVSTGGVGIAAPQLGISIRLIVCAFQDRGAEVLINPKILSKSGKQTCKEGCLSFPGILKDVERAEQVEVEYTDRSGERQVETFWDLDAVVVQHEIDHLDGIVFTDYNKLENL